ncbi:replicative DNA helicase [Calditrichota bacterium]
MANHVAELEGIRVPPQAIDVEQAVLAAMLLDKEAVSTAIETIDETYFYKESHRKIYLAIVDLYDRHEAVDMLTITEELKKKGDIEDVGGPYYISEIVNSVPSSANVEYHIKIVKQKALSRKLITVCNEIVTGAYQQEKDVGDLLDQAEQSIFKISEDRIKKGFESVNPILHSTFERIDELYHSSGTGITGIGAGFKKLDEFTAGFQKADFVVLAGRPSMGKTAFALNLMRNAAVDNGIPVGFFSLEMSAEALVLRLLCTESRVNQMAVRTGKMNAEEMKRLSKYVGVLDQAPIYIDDTPGLNVLQLRSKARRLVADKNVKMFIVDYLQLMEGSREESRQQEITKISRSLKGLAKELDMPVIALSQLSRAVETRDKSRKPQLSDLRESGAIEQDADVVLFVYRPEYYDIQTFEDTGESTINKSEIIIGKQRNGPVGTIRLTFLKEYGKFADPAPFVEESVYPTDDF